MTIAEKVWDALTTVLRMNDKIVSMSGQMKEQQQKIETLTIEVAELKMAVRVLLASQGIKQLPKIG